MGEDCCDGEHGPEGHVHKENQNQNNPVLDAELILEDDSPQIPSSEVPPIGEVIGDLLDSRGLDRHSIAIAAAH